MKSWVLFVKNTNLGVANEHVKHDVSRIYLLPRQLIASLLGHIVVAFCADDEILKRRISFPCYPLNIEKRLLLLSDTLRKLLNANG